MKRSLATSDITLSEKEVKALMQHLQRAKDDPAAIDETIRFVRSKFVLGAHLAAIDERSKLVHAAHEKPVPIPRQRETSEEDTRL